MSLDPTLAAALKRTKQRIERVSEHGDRAGLLIAVGQYHGQIRRAVAQALR
jgi:hypothetical protein